MPDFKIPTSKAGFETPKHRQRVSSTARRLANMGMALPDHLVEEGRQWYPKVHEASAKFIGAETAEGHKVTNIHQAAGVVAAVSPSMDFEGNNIKALGELQGMTKEHWDILRHSTDQPERTEEARSMLREVAPSMSVQGDRNLLKAQRIMAGEQWHDVLPIQTAPKTHHFALNIAEPGRDTGVTVDGRHHDIITNRMRSWTDYNRGISSAATSSGKPTRYEVMEDITRAAGRSAGRRDDRFAGILPHDMQAVLWVGGKWLERGGGVTKQGPKREGQRYTDSRGNLNAHLLR